MKTPHFSRMFFLALAVSILISGAGFAGDSEPSVIAQSIESAGVWMSDTSDWLATEWAAIQETDGYQTHVLDRLEMGLRQQYFKLTESKKEQFDATGTFIGGFGVGISTHRLREQQDYFPRLYARYRFNNYIAAEMGWEKMIAKTTTYWDGHSNGDIILSGPVILAVVYYPNETIFVPYGNFGLALMNGDFDHDSSWHVGAGYLRMMETGDAQGIVYGVGCTTKVWNRIAVDVAFRYMTAESDGTFYLLWPSGLRTNEVEFEWPLDNWAFQLGFKYLF